MTPTERWNQHCSRMRIMGGREVRRFLSGETQICRGEFERRSFLREIELAYMEGVRDGLSENAVV